MIRMLFLSLLIVIPNMVTAQNQNEGTELLKSCQIVLDVADGREELLRDGIANQRFGECIGFLEAVRGMQNLLTNADGLRYFCLPENGISNEQAARIVVNYLMEASEKLHKGSLLLTIVAFSNAFPCVINDDA